MKHLIVCDDDEDILNIISIVLKDQDFNIIKVKHCNYLEDALEKNNAFLVLIDLSFKNADVQKVIAGLKQKEAYTAIPFVVISAQEQVAKISKQVGAEDYISKPFSIAELKEKINSYIEASS